MARRDLQRRPAAGIEPVTAEPGALEVPPGQFAIYNAIPGPKRLIIRRAAHFEYEGAAGDERTTRAAIRDFLTTPLNAKVVDPSFL